MNSWFATCLRHVFKDPQGIAGPIDPTQDNAMHSPDTTIILPQDALQEDQNLHFQECRQAWLGWLSVGSIEKILT